MEWFAAERFEQLTAFLPPISILLIVVLLQFLIELSFSRTHSYAFSGTLIISSLTAHGAMMANTSQT